MITFPPTELSHLTFRREALLRRDLHKMTSFRLPKETTPQLLHFHSEDEPENDSATQEEEDKVVELPKFNRRKRALKRSEHRMTSFRLPKDKTHQLLAYSSFLVVLDDEEDEKRKPSSVAVTAPSSSIKSTPTTTAHPSATKTRTTTDTSKSRRRCRALQSLKNRHVMTSFRLPKETTPKLLHLVWNELDASDDADADAAASDCSKPHDTNQRAIPPQMVRQSSFSARTA